MVASKMLVKFPRVSTNSVVWLVLEASAIARMVSILDIVFWQLCIVFFGPLFLTLDKNLSNSSIVDSAQGLLKPDPTHPIKSSEALEN